MKGMLLADLGEYRPDLFIAHLVRHHHWFRGRPQEVYARMPVPKYATHYKMDHKKRGIALIFNHETFECGNLKSRAGTNEDCQNFKECLSVLGFDVKVFKDLTYAQLDSQVKKGKSYCQL